MVPRFNRACSSASRTRWVRIFVAVVQPFADLDKRAGLPVIRLHDLRTVTRPPRLPPASVKVVSQRI